MTVEGQTKLPVQSNEALISRNPTGWQRWRIVVAFWMLGMCNNYIYVIMLSAASDIIKKVSGDDTGNVTSAPGRECNDISTGAVLLADILPTLFVKLVFPFLPFLVHARVLVSVLAGITSIVLVGLSKSITIALVGVAFASFNSGLGELTFLAYSSYFPVEAVAAWSSGTGGAGLAGANAYATMTEVGLTPETTLYISLVVPFLTAIAFWVILKHPRSETLEVTASPETSQTEVRRSPTAAISSLVRKIGDDFAYIPQLLKFMIPIGLVYFLEYLINSGLFELLKNFKNTDFDTAAQFRWFNAAYQLGVFVSRSSVTWIKIEKVWLMSVLQAVNVVVLTLDAIYGFIPNVWVMLAVIFWEGLLGGAAYVNTFYTMSLKIPEERRLFALSIASVADTFGIVAAGFASFPVHDAICLIPYDPVFRWP